MITTILAGLLLVVGIVIESRALIIVGVAMLAGAVLAHLTMLLLV